MSLEHNLSVLLYPGTSPFIVLHFTVLHGCRVLYKSKKDPPPTKKTMIGLIVMLALLRLLELNL